MNSIQMTTRTPGRLGFTASIARCFRKYATFQGRATREEYWWFSLFSALLYLSGYVVFLQLAGVETAENAFGLVQLGLFLPSLAVGVRRLHDINCRGWWLLLGLTIVGIIPLCILFCLKGNAAANRFGLRDGGNDTEAEQKKSGEKGCISSSLLLCCLVGLFSQPCLAETPSGEESTASGQNLQQGLQEAFGGMFSIMGEVIGGMTKGMQEGARDIQAQLDGADGTRLIADREDLTALTETRVLTAEHQDDGSWRIVLAVKNLQEFPVRLTNLADMRQVLLLDKEGFVHERQYAEERVVTVPERATQKLKFFYPELEGSTPAFIRLYGMDFAVPQAVDARKTSR